MECDFFREITPGILIRTQRFRCPLPRIKAATQLFVTTPVLRYRRTRAITLSVSYISRGHTFVDSALSRLHFSGRYKLSDWRFYACAINVTSSLCSETAKRFWYKCHGLFVNSPEMITMKGCLKYRSIQYNIKISMRYLMIWQMKRCPCNTIHISKHVWYAELNESYGHHCDICKQ